MSKACPKPKHPLTTICPSRAEEEILSWECNVRSHCSPKFMQFISLSVYFILRLFLMRIHTHTHTHKYVYLCMCEVFVVIFEGVCFCFQGKIDIGQLNYLPVSWCNDLNMCTSWHCVYGTSWMSWWPLSTVNIMTLQADSLI